MDKSRIECFDICKGIAIILVIIGHIIPVDSYFHQLIYSFHIPVFFIISGYFMKPDKYIINGSLNFKHFLKSNQVLVLSYVFYSIAFMLFDIIRIFCINYPVKKIILNIWLFFTTSGINVIWFISTLFWGLLIASFLCNKINDKIVMAFVIFIMTFFSFLMGGILQAEIFQSSDIFKLFYYLCLAIFRPFSIIMFLLSGYFFKNLIRKMINMKWNKVLLFACFSLLITLATTFENTVIDIHLMKYENYLLYLIGAFSGSLFLLSLSKLLEKIFYIKKFFVFFGVNTIFIMCTHSYFNIIDFSKKIELLFNSSSTLVCIIFVLLIEISLTKLIGIKIRNKIHEITLF